MQNKLKEVLNMALVTKLMEFKDKESMCRFLMLYEDLFQPWSESVIKEMDYVSDKKYVKEKENGHISITTRGHHDDNVAELARRGINVINDNMVKIHIDPVDFKGIQNNFEKVRIKSGRFKYVLV